MISFSGSQSKILAGGGVITTQALASRCESARETGLACLDQGGSRPALFVPLSGDGSPVIRAVLCANRGSGAKRFSAIDAELALHVSRKLIRKRKGSPLESRAAHGWYRSQIPSGFPSNPNSETKTRTGFEGRAENPARKAPITLQRLFPDWINLSQEVDRVVS